MDLNFTGVVREADGHISAHIRQLQIKAYYKVKTFNFKMAEILATWLNEEVGLSRVSVALLGICTAYQVKN